MSMIKCTEYARLESEVESTLGKLVNLTASQLTAFRSADQNLFMHLDKELELAVGIKERAIGALRQHTKDHKCWPQAA
jgi:hypothetical protein